MCLLHICQQTVPIEKGHPCHHEMSPIENNVSMHSLFYKSILNISRSGKWKKNTLYAFPTEVLLSEKGVLISIYHFTSYPYNLSTWKRQPLYCPFIVQEKVRKMC